MSAANGVLRRNRAILQLMNDSERKNQFVVATSSIPNDCLSGFDDDRIRQVSIPKHTDAGPEIGEDAETDDRNRVVKTVASIPIDQPDSVYSHLFRLNKCYQAMANNNKMIAFTDDMPVRKAFYALVYNSMRTGLVLDSNSYEIIGVLSSTDFIMVLMKLWKFREAISGLTGMKLSDEELGRTDISNMPIYKWKEHLRNDGRLKGFQTIGADDSLYAAADRLRSSRIHRLPVMDRATGECLFIITHRRLLHFIWTHAALLPKPEFLRKKVRALDVGTWNNIKYIMESTPLIDALELLINGGISGVPVVKDDQSLELVSVYTRFDAISVAFDEDEDCLNESVRETLEKRRMLSGRDLLVVTVPEDIDLWSLLEVFLEKNVHRLFAVDEEKRLKGLISLSDVINFLVLRDRPPSAANHEYL